MYHKLSFSILRNAGEPGGAAKLSCRPACEHCFCVFLGACVGVWYGSGGG